MPWPAPVTRATASSRPSRSGSMVNAMVIFSAPGLRPGRSGPARCARSRHPLVTLDDVALGVAEEHRAYDAAGRLPVGDRVGVRRRAGGRQPCLGGPLDDGVDVVDPESKVVEPDLEELGRASRWRAGELLVEHEE